MQGLYIGGLITSISADFKISKVISGGLVFLYLKYWYNNLIMTPQDWAGFILTVLTIGGIVIGIIKFLIKHYLSELKPNSGSSLKDSVTRLEKKVDKLYDMMFEHLQNHK
jgi:hypothetical protein